MEVLKFQLRITPHPRKQRPTNDNTFTPAKSTADLEGINERKSSVEMPGKDLSKFLRPRLFPKHPTPAVHVDKFWLHAKFTFQQTTNSPWASKAPKNLYMKILLNHLLPLQPAL